MHSHHMENNQATRFAAWEQERQRKLELQRQEANDRTEDEECKFKPAINHKKGEKRRTKQ